MKTKVNQGHPWIQEIRKTAQQLLNADVVDLDSVQVQVQQRSKQSWSVSAVYQGSCAFGLSSLASTRCVGKKPDAAILSLRDQLNGRLRYRQKENAAYHQKLLTSALAVVVLDEKIRGFLTDNDPKALKQAIQALQETGFQLPGSHTWEQLSPPDTCDPLSRCL